VSHGGIRGAVIRQPLNGMRCPQGVEPPLDAGQHEVAYHLAIDAAGAGLPGDDFSVAGAIQQVAPAVTVKQGRTGQWTLRLNQAQLEVSKISSTPINPLEGWDPPSFDVVAHATITVGIPPNSYG
jgi:hypothetical protein